MNFMKKIFSYSMLLLAGAFAMTSCSDDLDSNPTLVNPTEFVLNTPAVTSGIVLENTKTIQLTWSQPQFTEPNAPVVAVYEVQVSPTGSFTKAYDDMAEDNTGADYLVLDETYTVCKAALSAEELNKAVEKILGWADPSEVPAQQQIVVRLNAMVQNATHENLAQILSNTVTLNTYPYYILLKDAPIKMWYLVGNMFGGKWGSVVGETALPMFIQPDYDYDKKEGTGVLEFTNWFGTGTYKDNNENDDYGFKIQPDDFNWDLGMTGNFGKKGEIIYRKKGDDGGHILAPADGFYTIKMDTKTLQATMEAYDGTVKNYGNIQISGTMNGWSDTAMLPYNKDGVENHVWYLPITVTKDMYGDRGVCEFKFKDATPTWDNNWGYGDQDGEINNRGVCGAGGKNIGIEEGDYIILFNDITGVFNVYAK